MKACDAVNMQSRDNGRRTGRAAVGLVSRRLEGFWAAPVVLLTAIIVVSPAQAAPTTPNCDIGRELLTIPEVTRDATAQKLKAVLMLSDEDRSMWVRKPGSSDGRCLRQHLRYLRGWNVTDWNAGDPSKPPSTGEPIPGPTLRARIGDLIQIGFRNQVDTKNFPITLDRGDCDEATGTLPDPNDKTKTIKVNVYPRNNQMPNCVHGSSTSNIHFHGTHTTPSTTGDNVLLLIRPALRVKVEGKSELQIQPTDAVVKSNFSTIFESCETKGSPTGWGQLPSGWQKEQERLLRYYDDTAPYKGVNKSLPPTMHLWPKNEEALDARPPRWPQYSVGAFPYCFKLPDKPTEQKKDEGAFRMGQSPGTHWYHAHVHGSTALNVANGLAGAFIIEGPYDDALRKFYSDKGNTLEEKVLVIQQLSTSLGLLSATRFGPPFLSVNGRRQPVITMRPGQVQMWRIVNAAYRSFVQFRNFKLTTSCSTETETPSEGETPCVDWRQTAQDGVQFNPKSYGTVGKRNAKFNMAGGNRVDLLVKAPSKAGSYSLTVWESTSESPTAAAVQGTRVREVTLLTVKVEDPAIEPAMVFIDENSFPTFPDFLKDLPPVMAFAPGIASGTKKNVAYDTTLGVPPVPPTTGSPPRGPLRGPLTDPDPVPVLPKHTIDGELFSEHIQDKMKMVLNTVEEWTVVNKAVGIAHPFHIHINPFQVVEVFDPQSAEASDKNNEQCYADPTKPETWKVRDDCDKLKLTPPFVWWDVRAIPAARNWEWVEPRVACDKQPQCPLKMAGASCRPNAAGTVQCTVPSNVVIPGYFKMRSHFADFPGVFVQHCHILAHEDVGMMQFVEVYDLRKGPRIGTIGLRHY